MSSRCLEWCANVAPKTRRDKKRTKELSTPGEMKTGKQKRRHGRARGDRQQTLKTQTGSEGKEKGKGGKKQTTSQQTETSGAERIREGSPTMAGRRGTSRGTPRPWRTFLSGRSMDKGFTPTLSTTLMTASATTRRGRHGGVTSMSCHQGATMLQAGKLGGALSGHSGKSCGRCGIECGTRSGSSSSRQ